MRKESPELSDFIRGFAEDLAPILGEIVVLDIQRSGLPELPKLNVTNPQPQLLIKSVELKESSDLEKE